MGVGRDRWWNLAIFLVFALIALRALAAVLPVPLRAERRRVSIALFVEGAPEGLAAVLRGENAWHARGGALLGRIVDVQTRPARDPSRRSWSAPLDLLAVVEGGGRYRRGKGLYLDRNLPIRVGETYPLRTTLGAFWGRVERITVRGRP